MDFYFTVTKVACLYLVFSYYFVLAHDVDYMTLAHDAHVHAAVHVCMTSVMLTQSTDQFSTHSTYNRCAL